MLQSFNIMNLSAQLYLFVPCLRNMSNARGLLCRHTSSLLKPSTDATKHQPVPDTL